MPWKEDWPPGRCGCGNEAWLGSGTGAEGCCCSICDWGSPKGFMIGDVMGTGGIKFSGTFSKMAVKNSKSKEKKNSNISSI